MLFVEFLNKGQPRVNVNPDTIMGCKFSRGNILLSLINMPIAVLAEKMPKTKQKTGA